MSGIRKGNGKRGVATITIAFALSVFSPILSSFAFLSAGSPPTQFPAERTSVLLKNAPTPAWIAEAIAGQGVSFQSAQNDRYNETAI